MSALVAEASNTNAVWERRKLSEVASVINGGTPKSKVTEFWNGSHQWLTPADMGKMEGREIGGTPRTITDQGMAKSSARLVPPKSVILSTRAPIGHLAINSVPMAFNQGCRGLVPGEKLDHVFLYYFLQANRDLLNDLGTGTTFKELSATNLKSVEIPLPPLEEQKRIVAVLDQAFAALDRASANAEANLADAEELFESALNTTFAKGGTGWQARKVGDLITLQRGHDITKKDQRPGRVPVVSSGGVRSFHNQARAAGPGVVVGRKGSIGTVHFVEDDFWPHDTTLYVKDFKGNDPRLVSYLLRGLKLAELDTGAANPSLNRNLVHPMSVRWPSDLDQSEIAKRLAEMEAKADRLSSSYRSKLSDLEDLRQSILQKAFAGELT